MESQQTPRPNKSGLLFVVLIIIIILIAAAGFFLLFKSKRDKASVASTVSPSPQQSIAISPVASGSVKDSHCLKTPAKNENIKVTAPADYSEVSKSKVDISGTANAFESQFDYRIKDCSENIIASGFVTASGEMGSNPPFQRTFDLSAENAENIIIELFEVSPADGRETNLTQIPLRIR